MPTRCTCWASWPVRRAAPEAAIDLIGRAIAINPAVAEYHSNLGESYRQSGAMGPGDRQSPPRDRIEARPGRGPQQPGHRLDGAGPARRGDRRLPPGDRSSSPIWPRPTTTWAIALRDQGRLDEAIAAYHRAIELKPDHAEAHSNLGIALEDQGRLDEAIAAYHRAIALKPDHGRGPQQPGQRAEGPGPARRGTGLLPQGRRAEAGPTRRLRATSSIACITTRTTTPGRSWPSIAAGPRSSPRPWPGSSCPTPTRRHPTAASRSATSRPISATMWSATTCCRCSASTIIASSRSSATPT